MCSVNSVIYVFVCVVLVVLKLTLPLLQTPPSLPTIQDADNTTSIESETPQQSWTGWIGSLVGWK